MTYSNQVEAGWKTKSALFIGGKAFVVILKSPKLRASLLAKTTKNPKLKKTVIEKINKFISNPKYAKHKASAENFRKKLQGKTKNVAKKQNSKPDARAGPDKLLDKPKSADFWRKAEGTTFGSKNLSKLSPKKWASKLNKDGVSIPKSVGEKLSGRTYKNFDNFRKDFWTEMSKNKNFNDLFSKGNQTKMREGLAPSSMKSGHYKTKTRYEVHHVKEIQNGGSVYSMDNLIIVTAKRHKQLHGVIK